MTSRREPPGEEPDPRFSLANERTYLAWVRTMLAVLAGAVALESLEIPRGTVARHVLVVALILFAGATTVAAYRRWQRVELALRQRAPLPAFATGAWLAAAVALTALALAALVIAAGS